MNFDEWFKEKTQKKIDKMSVSHPIISQVRKKADTLLIKSYNYEIKSIFQVESARPNIIDNIEYKLKDYNKYSTTFNKYGLAIYHKLSEGFKLLNSKLALISAYIDAKFNEKLIKEGKMDTLSVQAANSIYDYNSKLYRQLTLRRWGNSMRNLFGVQKYFLIENSPVKIKPYYHIFYKLYKITPMIKIKPMFIIFGILLAVNYRIGLIVNKQNDVISSDDKKIIIFDEKKDKMFMDIYKYCTELLNMEYNPDKYQQFNDKDEQLRELVTSTLNHKLVFDLSCMGIFLIGLSINMIKNFKHHKGFTKKLKFMTYRFLTYYLGLSLLMKFTANNCDGYFRLEAAKLLLDQRDNDLNDFNFYVENMRYLI